MITLRANFVVSKLNDLVATALRVLQDFSVCHSCQVLKIVQMQLGREDNLVARYAIQFCFKLGKTATESYDMVKTAFGPTLMSRATVYRWHKRFQEGRKQVRDDERCDRDSDVRTPQFIEKVSKFLNEDRRPSL